MAGDPEYLFHDSNKHSVKTRSIPFCILLGLAAACTSDRDKLTTKLDSIFLSKNFDTTLNYKDSCSLFFKEKPLFKMGQLLNQLDNSFSYSLDANGTFQNEFDLVTDHYSTDTAFTKKQASGSLNGIVYFTTDKKGRVFTLHAAWLLDIPNTAEAETEAINTLRKDFFPCLPDDFNYTQTFRRTHKLFIEDFAISRSPDSADADHGYVPHKNFIYSVTLKNDSWP
jgi:hypothetical protein